MGDEEEEDEAFGDFTFAPQSKSQSQSNASLNDDDDDDDWGDFVTHSTGLGHILSLPNSSLKPAFDSFEFTSSDQCRSLDSCSGSGLGPVQPASVPGRIGAGLGRWEKCKGAIPLSIFGVEEENEEEGLGVVDPTFRDQGGSFLGNGSKGAGGVGSLSDLVAGLYEKGMPGNGSVVVSGSGGKVSSFGALELSTISTGCTQASTNLSLNGLVVNGGNNGGGLRMSEEGLEWDPLNLNVNGESLEGKSVLSVLKDADLSENWGSSGAVDGNEGIDDGGHNEYDDDDEDNNGWEFKVADVKVAFEEEVPKANHIEAGNGVSKLESSWNLSNLDFTFWNLEATGVTSIVSSDNEKVGGDFLWGFNEADSSTKLGNQNLQVDQIKKENGPTFGFNGSNSSWKMFNLVGDGTNSNPNVVNLDSKELPLDIVGEIEDPVTDDEWDFKAAELNVGNSNSKEDEEKTPAKSDDNIISSIGHNSSGQDDLFASGPISSGQDDLFASFQGPSPNLGFSFNLSSVIQNNNVPNTVLHNENANSGNNLHVSPAGGNVSSIENSWAFKDAVLETGSEDKAKEEKLDNHRVALPLSFFGEEENETNDPVISEDISSNKPTSNPTDGVKSPWQNVSIKDLISILYSEVDHNGSTNHVKGDYTDFAFNPSESGLCPSSSMGDLDLTNGDDNIGDDTWEFQDASFENIAEDHDPVHGKYSAEVELEDCIDFFSKLKDELHLAAQCNLENLKDHENELHEDGITSATKTPEEKHFDKFVKILHEPKFCIFETEYELSKKLSMVENDLRLANELLKLVTSIVRILEMAPREDQLSFVSTWSKVLAICAQELRHGALIWNQVLERNLQDKMLSELRGKEYVHSLGEIYRVVEILGSSARLYKPWILTSSADSKFVFPILSECVSLWSSSGLEEALQSISTLSDSDSRSYKTLLESIKRIRDMDAVTLYSYAFSREEPTCQLSLVPTGAVPGMKSVIWNGKCYLLTLANFWANLIECNPPNLPSVCIV